MKILEARSPDKAVATNGRFRGMNGIPDG